MKTASNKMVYSASDFDGFFGMSCVALRKEHKVNERVSE
jgi:hypothetical protein